MLFQKHIDYRLSPFMYKNVINILKIQNLLFIKIVQFNYIITSIIII